MLVRFKGQCSGPVSVASPSQNKISVIDCFQVWWHLFQLFDWGYMCVTSSVATFAYAGKGGCLATLGSDTPWFNGIPLNISVSGYTHPPLTESYRLINTVNSLWVPPKRECPTVLYAYTHIAVEECVPLYPLGEGHKPNIVKLKEVCNKCSQLFYMVVSTRKACSVQEAV